MAGDRTRARGELEAEVMRILWGDTHLLSARDIQDRFTGRTPAYTTLMTALDRLEKKGRVIREGESPRKVKFRATRSVDDHASQEMVTALDAAGDRKAALLRFAGNLGAEDLELLREAIAPRKLR
jgi:predicted transcriptional regulator